MGIHNDVQQLVKVSSNGFEYLELLDEKNPYSETAFIENLRTSTLATDNWSCPSLINSRASVGNAVATEEVETDKLLPIQRSEENTDDNGTLK